MTECDKNIRRFSGEETLMRDDLHVSGNIPTTSPYVTIKKIIIHI